LQRPCADVNSPYKRNDELNHKALYINHYCEGATSHIFGMVWLYRSPISVGRKGFFFLFK
jgi:hypothetical protein